MPRPAVLAVSISLILAMVIAVGGLIPRDFWHGPIRHDGPIVHAAAFALLVLPLTLAWPRRWLFFVLLAVLFGGALEGLQTFVGRAPEWSDMYANISGSLLGAIIALALSSYAKREM